MAIRSKPNWKVLDPLIPVLEQYGWSHKQIAQDWGLSLATLEGHFKENDMAKAPDWLDDDIQEFYPVYNGGIMAIQAAIWARRGVKIAYMTITEHMKRLGLERPREKSRREKVHRSTPEGHQETPKAHPSTPEESERWTVHPGTPESPESGREEQYTQEHPEPPAHQGTLEGHQEVMEDVSQSVPDAPHIGTEEFYQSTPEHPSTPEVHPELSPDDSNMAHSGVPARQQWPAEVPAVHPGTPTAEDWELWTNIRAQWGEVEKMLAERHTRQALLSTPAGTPRHTIEKTYVVDTFYVELIDRYAKEHSLDLKDVLNVAFQRFFEQEGYLRQ